MSYKNPANRAEAITHEKTNFMRATIYVGTFFSASPFGDDPLAPRERASAISLSEYL